MRLVENPSTPWETAGLVGQHLSGSAVCWMKRLRAGRRNSDRNGSSSCCRIAYSFASSHVSDDGVDTSVFIPRMGAMLTCRPQSAHTLSMADGAAGGHHG